MRDNFSTNSRYKRTQKSKKQTLILNILIGVVFIGILAVGASMLLGDDESATEKQQNQDNTASVPETDENSDESSNNDSSNEQAAEEENKENETNTDSESKEEDDTSVEKEEEEASEGSSEDSEGYKTYSDDTAGPDGAWEPVGTVQKDSHQSSFEKGTTDWKEKEKALQYATGLSPDEIEYWWIGNGGSATTAKGIVSKAENKDNPYVVMLEWVDGEGWKPTSVERVPGAANQ
ncbi:DUF1510 family protein [Alkalihalobacillus sp. TS-13]|uniref:DUF1510 family protein n=1 Tax=Alkalihalobacillus sp. TS-13 TaxID=2842455 RepID=UPI001C877C67|nr:DUF1510 family protein [Alkalihalobacillus sp. TS-13]